MPSDDSAMIALLREMPANEISRALAALAPEARARIVALVDRASLDEDSRYALREKLRSDVSRLPGALEKLIDGAAQLSSALGGSEDEEI